MAKKKMDQKELNALTNKFEEKITTALEKSSADKNPDEFSLSESLSLDKAIEWAETHEPVDNFEEKIAEIEESSGNTGLIMQAISESGATFEMKRVSREEFEKEFPSPEIEEAERLGSIAFDEFGLKKNDCIKYDGTNGIEIMNFCQAYHMECKAPLIILWILKDGVKPVVGLELSPGDILVKDEDGQFRVEK